MTMLTFVFFNPFVFMTLIETCDLILVHFPFAGAKLMEYEVLCCLAKSICLPSEGVEGGQIKNP